MSSHMSRYFFAQHKLEIHVDLSSQVLNLELDKRSSTSSEARRLHPTLKGIDRKWNWVPAMAFALKAKAFDDGLYAAVELLTQNGTPLLPGRRRIVEQVH